jgi:hypothetical protein
VAVGRRKDQEGVAARVTTRPKSARQLVARMDEFSDGFEDSMVDCRREGSSKYGSRGWKKVRSSS